MITCALHPCFRSATGVSTCSLVGSSLEPAAGSTSPSASTRPREAFGHLWRPWSFIWAPLGSIGVPLNPCWCLVGTSGCGPGPLAQLLWKRLQKGIQNHRIGEPGGEYFDDILSFCGKWQAAFGLRLCSRIRVPAPCFQPLSLHWGPLFFQRFFDVFWAPKNTQKSTTGEGRRQSRHPVN